MIIAMNSSCFCWLENSFFMFPPMSKSIMNSLHTNSRKSAPLGDSIFFTVDVEKNVFSSIVGLFKACPPYAIIRVIPLAVVNSFYGKVVSRFITHVRKEIFKRIPSFTNFYTPISVIRELFIGWVVTPLFHAHPNGIFWRVGTTVDCKSFNIEFRPKASAGLGSSISQGYAKGSFSPATITNAIPHGSVLDIVLCPADHSKPSKFLTRKVFKIAHKITSNIINKTHKEFISQVYGYCNRKHDYQGSAKS